MHQLEASWPNQVLKRTSRRASRASAAAFLAKPGNKTRMMASIMCIISSLPSQSRFLSAHHGEHHVHQSWPEQVLNRTSRRASCASAVAFLAKSGWKTPIMASVMRISWRRRGQTRFSTAHHGESASSGASLTKPSSKHSIMANIMCISRRLS